MRSISYQYMILEPLLKNTYQYVINKVKKSVVYKKNIVT